MDNLNFFSLNVRGLKSDSRKRKKIFDYFRKKTNMIVYLQETHSTPEVEQNWKDEWNGEIIFSHGSSQSRGVAVLIPKTLSWDIKDIITDSNGRYIILKICNDNECYVLVNVYAPTQKSELEQINFISELQHLLKSYEGHNIMMGGDFNVILDPLIDKKGGNTDPGKSSRYRSELKGFYEALDICDIWRIQNENKFGFTWHNKKTKIFCRLDYWLVSEHLINRIEKADILPSVNSDHSIISLRLNLMDRKRGPSYWKFNTALLKDKEYVELIKTVIANSAEKHESEDKNLKWELIKMEIRAATISYSIRKRKREKQNENDLHTKLKKLHELIADNINDETMSEIASIENELRSIENETMAGSIMRSKIIWAEQNEKNSAYFLNLEKRNYVNKHITQLNINGTIIKKPQEILEQEKIFYENLYKEKTSYNSSSVDNLLQSLPIPTINEEQKQFCELKISPKECAEALKTFKNNKSPGIDGIPADFYKFSG